MSFKTPKVTIPQTTTEEAPVTVQKVTEGTIQDYNEKSKNRKTLLSTVLTKQYLANESQSSHSGTTGSGLRETLG